MLPASRKLNFVTRGIWIAAVLAFLVLFALRNRSHIPDLFVSIPVSALVVSLCSILFAKAGLAFVMYRASARSGLGLSYMDCFHIYNVTQLAKYVPGSFWQFVGRISILRERSLTYEQIWSALLLEHVWVVGSSAVSGLPFLLLFAPRNVLAHLYEKMGFAGLWLAAVLSVLLFLGVVMALSSLRKKTGMAGLRAFPSVMTSTVLVFIWILLGLSLRTILLPFSNAAISFPYVFAVYCLAYVVGFLAPFAPAGLGIRESFLVLALLPFINLNVIIFVAAMHRILYFLSELLLCIPCFLRGRLWGGRRTADPMRLTEGKQ